MRVERVLVSQFNFLLTSRKQSCWIYRRRINDFLFFVVSTSRFYEERFQMGGFLVKRKAACLEGRRRKRNVILEIPTVAVVLLLVIGRLQVSVQKNKRLRKTRD